MIIHSIISPDDIFFNQTEPDIIERDIDGGKLSMIKINGEYKPYRLFSTDPALYLNSEYQP